MPGLFGVDTPEDVRARIGRTGREQDLSLAQLPAGRGAVALSSQLGRGAVQGGAQLLGMPTLDQRQGQKNTLIQESIKATASQMGITRAKNPVEYLGLTSKILAENGETQAATNALKFAGEIDRLTNLGETALSTNIKKIFNIPRSGSIAENPKASELMKKILTLQSQPQRGVVPADKGVSSTDVRNSVTFLADALKGDTPIELPTAGDETNTFTFDDFANDDNRRAFALAHAERKRFLKNSNKQKGNPALSDSALNKQVLREMKPFLSVTGDDVIFDLGDEQMVFDNEGFADVKTDLLQEAVGEVGATNTGTDLIGIGDR